MADASEVRRQARGDGCCGKGAFRRRSIGRGEHQYQRDLSIKDVSKAHRDLEARKAPVRRCLRSSGLPIWRSTSMRGRAAQVFKVIFISETRTFSHQFYIRRSSSPMR